MNNKKQAKLNLLQNRERYNQLFNSANAAKIDMQAAMQNLKNVSDPDIIDIYIYELQKAQVKYDHIIKEMREF